MTDQPPKAVLFTCTQNAVRSVIAEALLKQAALPSVTAIASCGVIEGVPDGFAIAVMSEQGVDISEHEPRDFDSCSAQDFDMIISFSPDAHYHAKSWAASGCELLFWDVRPPQHNEGSREDTLQSYRMLRDEISRKLDETFTSA